MLVALTACGQSAAEVPPAAPAPSAVVPASATSPAQARTSPPPAPATTQDSPATIHGELAVVQGQRVLRVWGTPTQMGHAHGFLLRDSILEIVDGYALDVIPPTALATAASLYTTIADISPRLREETEGIIAGMKQAGGARVPGLDRDLQASDLLVLNAMTDLLAIGCSSVSAWGPSTADAPQLAGAPALVRNLDWSEDPQLLGNQVIIVYRPDDPKRQPVVSVAFAGYVGCLSCMNEAGVSALFNMGYGEGAAGLSTALAGFSPSNLLLRDALEQRDIDGDGRSTADDVEALWRRKTHAGSYILHLIEPRRSDVDTPARVLEVEADGVVRRDPDAEGALGPQMLAATNHLRRKTEPSSCSRYRRVERTVTKAEHQFDRDSLWALGSTLRLPQVVHAVLVEPEARALQVWLRKPSETDDATSSPVAHTWSSLVGTPGAAP